MGGCSCGVDGQRRGPAAEEQCFQQIMELKDLSRAVGNTTRTSRRHPYNDFFVSVFKMYNKD